MTVDRPTVYHRIDTREGCPIRQTLRRLPITRKPHVGKMLENMKRLVAIKGSDSPKSYTILVQKNGY
jgi:hypothetical protein